jgi:hypothetical protein
MNDVMVSFYLDRLFSESKPFELLSDRVDYVSCTVPKIMYYVLCIALVNLTRVENVQTEL